MIPISYKARIRWTLIRLRDFFSSYTFAKESDAPCGVEVLQLEQPFFPSETLEGKKHNLRRAAECINRIVVMPGEVFSFWRVVGNPNNPHRFAPGRSLHAGKPVKDYGGGLCQASGIIHHAALSAGLDILERHNHSVDLYTDDTRFAPLGSDATVFYGYKDLRIRNSSVHPLRLELSVESEKLVFRLYSDAPINVDSMQFLVSEASDGSKKAEVINSQGKVVSRSVYKSLHS